MADAKAQQEKHWDAVADGWSLWLAWTERNFAPITDWLADAAGWAPGVRALDVGCGAGYPARIAASRIRPDGTLVAIDLSPSMVAAASAALRAAGLDGDCRRMDAEDLRFEDRSFDAVTNVYGLMFCPDAPRALAEACRVLDEDGRIAVVTWAEPAASPFFTLISGVAAPWLGLAPPETGAPGPFRFADPSALAALLRASGFAGVRVERRETSLECESADEYFRMFVDLAWRSRVARLAHSDRASILAALRQAVGPYVKDGGRLALPAVSLCASAVKAPAR